MRAVRRLAFASALVWLASAGAPAQGATVSISSAYMDGPDLGAVALASGPSVLRIDPDSGAVTTVSGGAQRLSSGPCEPPVITVSCTVAQCDNAFIVASFSPGGGGRRASVKGFIPGSVTSKGLVLQSIAGAGTEHLSMTFVAPRGGPASASFPLGLLISLGSSNGSGRESYGYTMTVTKN